MTSAASAPTRSRSAGCDSVPVASANAVSPSTGVCTGQIARAKPSCAICATFDACVLVSRAFVATTTSVVFSPGRPDVSPPRTSRRTSASECPSSPRTPATTCPVAGSITSPIRIDGGQRRDDQPVGHGDGGGADPRFHRVVGPARVADRGAGARADAAFLDRLRAGEAGGAIAAVGGRPDPRIADAKVEQDRGRHDRHARDADVEADVVFLEPADDAGRGVEAEGAAAGQHDRVDLFDRVDRRQQIGLARARRRAAHVHAGDRARFREHDRAAGRPLAQREVPDLDAVNRGQRLVRSPLIAGSCAVCGRGALARCERRDDDRDRRDQTHGALS